MTTSAPRIAVIAGEGGGIQNELPPLLTRLGVPFERVASGALSDATIEQLKFDIFMIEDPLPSMDIIALMPVLHGKKSASEVLIVSASQNLPRALECMRAGAADYVAAPLDEILLKRSIDRIVSSSNRINLDAPKEVSHRYLKSIRSYYELRSDELSQIRFNVDVIDHLQDSGRIDSKTRLQLELAFQEALTNSLEHGNLELISEWKDELTSAGIDRYQQTKSERLLIPEYASRMIFITIELDGEILTIKIKDQGKGFDVEGQRKKSRAELDCYGRGLPIMDKVLDQLNYSLSGTEVTLIKYLR